MYCGLTGLAPAYLDYRVGAVVCPEGMGCERGLSRAQSGFRRRP